VTFPEFNTYRFFSNGLGQTPNSRSTPSVKSAGLVSSSFVQVDYERFENKNKDLTKQVTLTTIWLNIIPSDM
jgi:hypothetical protein